jgi:hypothetical protein
VRTRESGFRLAALAASIAFLALAGSVVVAILHMPRPQIGVHIGPTVAHHEIWQPAPTRVRPANVYEQLLVGDIGGKATATRSISQPVPIRSRLVEAIELVASDRRTPQDAMSELQRNVAPPVIRRTLLEFIRSPQTVAPQRTAGVAMFVQLAEPRDVPLLLDWYADRSLKSVVATAVYRLVPTSNLIAMPRSDRDATVRAELIRATLSRPAGVDAYLDLVLDSSTRDAALDAVRSMPEPPTDALMAALDDARVDRRHAAAKALGVLCDGQLLPSLRRMIETRDPRRREALAVLSECSDPAAIQYAEQLERRPSSAGELHAVRAELRRLF